MGNLVLAIRKRHLYKLAFFPPKPPSYTENHPYLLFVDGVATFQYKHTTKASKVILYSHGNGADLGRVHIFLHKLAKEIEMDIVAYDYPGYGLSYGTPTQESCFEAITKVYHHLLKTYAKEDIIVYGSSIGTGPSCFLISSYPVSGCLLQSPFTSVFAVQHEFLETSAKICELGFNFFENYKYVAGFCCPVVFLHGRYDSVVPFEHSQNLAIICKNLNKQCSLIELPEANHNDIETDHFPWILACIRRFTN